MKLAYISTTQYGCTRITVPMKRRLGTLDRNGLIFIQAITLCSDQEILRNMALTDSHHA